jgi:hypothetical protein
MRILRVRTYEPLTFRKRIFKTPILDELISKGQISKTRV